MSYSRVWQYGIPFMIFIFGGSYGLREFTELRYKYKSTTQYSIRDEFEKRGVETRPLEEITIEKEYEKLQKVDLDSWKNVRISRPWEEPENTKV